MKRTFKNKAKTILRILFNLGQHIGLDILPRHFYSQIPDMRELSKNTSWKRPTDMSYVEGSSIADVTANFSSLFSVNFDIKLQSLHSEAIRSSSYEGGFGDIESCVLYRFIISKNPKNIVQVGCGVSTFVILKAIEEYSLDVNLTCIEPYPNESLKKFHAIGKINLIEEKAQDLNNIKNLLSSDELNFLFVDSTHSVQPGSEVNKIVLEWLAEMPENSYIHFHDIYFPYEYQRELLTKELFFSSETTLLLAFLKFNTKFKIFTSLSMIHYEYPEIIEKYLPHYQPIGNDQGLEIPDSGKHFPSSLYLYKQK